MRIRFDGVFEVFPLTFENYLQCFDVYLIKAVYYFLQMYIYKAKGYFFTKLQSLFSFAIFTEDNTKQFANQNIGKLYIDWTG